MTKTTKQKPALIFIHGFRGSPLGLTWLLEHFSDYQVFAPNIPPFGDCTPLERYDVEHYVNFIIQFIKKNHLEKPILIGHSMGSIIVAAIAAQYPNLINSRIFLLSPISKRPAIFFRLLQPLVIFLPNHILSYASTKFLYVQHPTKHTKQFFKQILDLTHRCAAKYTSRQDVLAATIFSTRHSISDFNFHPQQKIILISGQTDRLIPRKNTDALAHSIHAASYYIPHSGHLINYEAPAKLAKLIKKHL